MKCAPLLFKQSSVLYRTMACFLMWISWAAIALILVCIRAQALDPLGGSSRSTGVDPGTRSKCNFDGTIVLGLPVTLNQDSKFFEMGQVQVAAQTILLDYVNEQQCGVKIANKTYAVEANYYDDDSNADYVKGIAETLVDPRAGIDLILAGYSSSLTEHISSIAQHAGRLLVASGASLSSVFKDRNLAFSVLPPSSLFFKSSLEAVVTKGAKTVVTITEDSSALLAMCGAVPQWAADLGMEFLEAHNVGPTPNYTLYEPVAQAAARLDPDVVITCTYECVDWVQAMRAAEWSPKAVMMAICMGSDQFVHDMGSDASYMMGPSAWHPTTTSNDALTGWSGIEFASRFKLESSHEQLTYHAASFMSGLSILIQSVEGASTIDNAKIAKYMAENTFTTIMGEIAFDENGQNINAPFVIQHDAKGEVQTVYPAAYVSGDLLYPMPSWDRRDCLDLSICPTTGSCGTDGKCVCDVSAEFRRSIGTGANAWCAREENMNFISWRLKAVGYGLFCVLMILAILAALWTWTNRFSWIVKASQPEQLAVMIFGCGVSGMSILFMGVETEYRQEIDSSGLSLETANSDLWSADKSCMAVPWLYGLGFALSFSSLFAKIERVRLISIAGHRNQSSSVKIGIWNVIHIVFLLLFLELTILLSWQLSSPLQWERSVLEEENGIAMESVGYCTSEHGPKFLAVLLALHISSLLYALMLCSKTHHIDDDFAESSSVSLSVGSLFQVMVLAIPISIIVGDSNGVLYIVQVFTVVLQTASILLTIFVPKALRLLRHKDKPDQSGNAKEKIPMSALTHSTWDEGVDVIDRFLEAECNLTTEQKQDMQKIKSLLLFRGSRGTRKTEEKLAYIPTALLGQRQENFIVEEFGGLTLKASQAGHLNRSIRELSVKDAFYAPAEFHTLSLEKKLQVCDMLSLSSLGRWGFDIFKLADITGGNPLIFVGWAIMGSPEAQETMARLACNMKPTDPTTDFEGYHFSSWASGIGISIETLCNYLRVIQSNYLDNPFHNAIHAADVLQSLHCLMQMVDVIEPSSEDAFSILLAAAVHDVKHPGRNNAFQKNAVTGCALAFSDAATLENFHLVHALELMLDVDVFSLGASPLDVKAQKKSSTNILRNMNRARFNAIRAKLSEAVLSTDMSKHFQTTSTIKNLVSSMTDQPDRGNADDKEKDTWDILLFLLHMADISGQAKPSHLASIWTNRVMDEFFSQGDEEKKMNIPVSPLCDRNTVQVMEAQVNFIKFVARPAFEVLANLSPLIGSRVLPCLHSNLDMYVGRAGKTEQRPEQRPEQRSEHVEV